MTPSYNPAGTTAPACHVPSVWALPLSLAATQGIADLLSLPPGTEMFQFPGYAPRFSAGRRGLTPARFPHSGTPGSTLACSYPRLFAACHALLRPPVPRHPLHALSHSIPSRSKAHDSASRLRRRPASTRSQHPAHTRSNFNCQSAKQPHASRALAVATLLAADC